MEENSDVEKKKVSSFVGDRHLISLGREAGFPAISVIAIFLLYCYQCTGKI
jgi:hypothetical protein